MRTLRAARYSSGARHYDLLSGERPVYRVGRVEAIGELGLRPGARVLDIGCGTGLNFPLLQEQIGDAGQLVGLDASQAMLDQARQRIAKAGWRNVELIHADAARLDEVVGTAPYDAVLFTYSLSIISDWRSAWAQARAVLLPGGRAAIVDLSLPSGWGLPWWPLARLAGLAGGSDPFREPWRVIEEELEDVSTFSHWAGHVRVAVGTQAAPR